MLPAPAPPPRNRIAIRVAISGGSFFSCDSSLTFTTTGFFVIKSVMLIVFALVPVPAIASFALLFTGLGGAGFSIMQATLVYLSAPPEMRSRVLGVLSVCIGTGPVGFVALGWLADAIGAPWATAATGVTGLMMMLLTRPLWRAI